MTMRTLLVEDDPFIALDLAQQLNEAGFDVVGPASRSADALKLIAAPGCDVAVLDVNLGVETSEAVAVKLTQLGVPFITLSGYSAEQHPPAFKAAPLLAKPVKFNLLVQELRRLPRRTHA